MTGKDLAIGCRAIVGLRVRLTTAFNRILQLPGASVHTVAFTDQGLVIGLRRRRRRLRLPLRRDHAGPATTPPGAAGGTWTSAPARCGWRPTSTASTAAAAVGSAPSRCRGPGPDARHTSDFENVVAWLAQRMDKTSIGRLLRCSWEAVDAIVARVVADHIDDTRLDQLYRIGVDEISYKRGHRFLTIVADHDTGNVVWVGKERSKAAFEEFFTALGPQRAAAIEAISLDGSSVYLPVAREQIPQATICLDPFHVIKWTNEVVESVYRAEAPNIPARAGAARAARLATRPLRGAGRPRDTSTTTTARSSALLRRHRYRLWRTWELKEQLRDLYRSTDPADARAYLKRWCTAAKRSRIPAFANLVRRIAKHFDAIIAAVELGLSNSRLEGINAKIRLIQRRGYGFRNLDALSECLRVVSHGVSALAAALLR